MTSKLTKSGTTVKMGRPTVITENTVTKLVEALKLGVTDELACATAKISRETFYNHLKEDPDFSDKILWARNYARIVAGNNVVADIEKGNIDSSKWWLEKKHPEEFGSKANVGVNIQADKVLVMPSELIDKYGISSGSEERSE